MLVNAALRASRSGVQGPIAGSLSVLDRLAAGFGTAATASAPPEASAASAVDIAALRERLASGKLVLADRRLICIHDCSSVTFCSGAGRNNLSHVYHPNMGVGRRLWWRAVSEHRPR